MSGKYPDQSEVDRLMAEERSKPTFWTDKELPEGHSWLFRGHEHGYVGGPDGLGYVACYRCKCGEILWRTEWGIRPHWDVLASVSPGGAGYPLAGTFGV